MKLSTKVPKLGNPKEYIGKPFNDEKGKQIGQIISCIEKDSRYELTIKADIKVPDRIISFEIKGK